MPWNRGDQIVLRYWTPNRVGPTNALPVTVVQDDLNCTAFFLSAGTPIKRSIKVDGSDIPRDLPFEERYRLPKRTDDRTWHTESRLYLATPGASHAYSLFWSASDWSFQGWYIDLQAPFRRTPIGFDSEDHVLDLVVDSDLSWSWKDEDEFADAVRIGRFSNQQAAEVRAEGERVIENIEAGGWPFNAGWESWSPDPGWTTPPLPAGWDRNYRD